MDKILVTARHRHQSGNSFILGNSIRVVIEGATVKSAFIPCLREYDSSALNQLRKKGAMVNIKNQERIDNVVDEFVSKYNLPMQDNSTHENH